MKLQVFTIFDSAANVYDPPLCFRADGEALRFWKSVVLNAETKIGKNPEDYSFYKIGVYDDNSAEFEACNRFCVQTGQEVVADARHIEPGSLKNVNGDDNHVGGTD